LGERARNQPKKITRGAGALRELEVTKIGEKLRSKNKNKKNEPNKKGPEGEGGLRGSGGRP